MNNQGQLPHELRKAQIENILGGNEISDIEKGGQRAVIGERREFAGRTHVKTIDGWKYVGQGTGSEAQKHMMHAVKTPQEEAKVLGVDSQAVETPKVDINQRFEAYSRYVKAVIQKKFKSCIAYGSGGTGKTYTALQQLRAAGMKEYDEDKNSPAMYLNDDQKENGEANYDFVKISGQATPTALYKALYEHNGKILLFDDCDSVLQNEVSVNLLKAALDTTGDGTVTYASGKDILGADDQKIPQRFKFKGRVIFISNLSAGAMPQPLKSRSLSVDLTMDRTQTVDRIEKIATNPKTKELTNLTFPNITYKPKDLRKVIDFAREHKDNFGDLSIRTIGALLAIKGISDSEGTDWKEDAEHMVFSKGENDSLYKKYEKALGGKTESISYVNFDPLNKAFETLGL